jgi:hypothetical protein
VPAPRPHGTGARQSAPLNTSAAPGPRSAPWRAPARRDGRILHRPPVGPESVSTSSPASTAAARPAQRLLRLPLPVEGLARHVGVPDLQPREGPHRLHGQRDVHGDDDDEERGEDRKSLGPGNRAAEKGGHG